MLRGLIQLALLLSWTACTNAGQSPPLRSGARAYAAALRNPDPQPMYRLLSQAQRKKISYKVWQARWQSTHKEREQRAQAMEDTLKLAANLQYRGEFRLPEGSRVQLSRREGEGWRLQQPLVGPKLAGSPREALRFLANAVQSQNMAGVLQILSKARRQEVQRKLDEMRKTLRKHGGDEIYRPTPKRAELTWGEDGIRYKIVFIEEDGGWRIDDLHSGADPVPVAVEQENTP